MNRTSRRHGRFLRGTALLLFALCLSPLLAASAAQQPVRTPAYVIPPLPFDAQVNQLGVNQFPFSYAGIKTDPDGSIVIYISLHDPAFLAAVAAADISRIPYTYAIVARSYAELDRLTKTLADQFKDFEPIGIHLMEDGPDPDPTLSRVDVWLGAPSSTDLATLAKALGVDPAVVTTATYQAEAQAYLVHRYGPAISVQPDDTQPLDPLIPRRDATPVAGESTS